MNGGNPWQYWTYAMPPEKDFTNFKNLLSGRSCFRINVSDSLNPWWVANQAEKGEKNDRKLWFKDAF